MRAAGLDGFWVAVRGLETLQAPVPAERWDADGCYSAEQAPGKSYARFAAFVRVRRQPRHRFHYAHQNTSSFSCLKTWPRHAVARVKGGRNMKECAILQIACKHAGCRGIAEA